MTRVICGIRCGCDEPCSFAETVAERIRDEWPEASEQETLDRADREAHR